MVSPYFSMQYVKQLSGKHWQVYGFVFSGHLLLNPSLQEQRGPGFDVGGSNFFGSA